MLSSRGPRALRSGSLCCALAYAAASCTPLTGIGSSATEGTDATPASDRTAVTPLEWRRSTARRVLDAGSDRPDAAANGGHRAGSAHEDRADAMTESADAGGASLARDAGSADQSAGVGGAAGDFAPVAAVEVECLPIGIQEIIGQRLEVQCEKPLSLGARDVSYLSVDTHSNTRATERFLELAIGAFLKKRVLRASVIPTGLDNRDGCPPERCRTLRSIGIKP